ncbi:MAG: sigma-70 family RNA polymerase sigma factor [Actinomycetota bacterium]|nr:sigma-70 family RNA polymerase sigma factor [Actinomycetota bacterium]
MEASALQAPAGIARARISVGAPLLRLRSDDQLLTLFRAGNDDAFRVIHDRYRQRLFAYTRQMLPGSTQDAEDALQDVFVRAYSGLRATHRPLALRPWLYRVAHNRCVDEFRKPPPPPPAILHQASAPAPDPIAQVEQRESLRRLITDLRRLPAQQRSALLMRELGGMSYADVATAMEVTVPAVKSLLVRARIGLTLAAEARDTACVTICEELTLAHDRGVRSSGTVRRHLVDCGGCQQFQSQLRSSRRQFAALAPTLGPLGLVAKLLGIGGGGAASGGAGAAATGGATATTGVVLGGGTAAVGSFAAGATHVATLIAAAVVTAGGAVAIDHSITTTPHRHAVDRPAVVRSSPPPAAGTSQAYPAAPYEAPHLAVPASSTSTKPAADKTTATTTGGTTTATLPGSKSISGGDNIVPTASPPSSTTTGPGTGAPGDTTTGTGSPTRTSGTGTPGTTGTGSPGTTGTSSAGAGPAGTGATGNPTGTGTGNPSSTASGTPAGAGTPTGTGSTGTPNSPTGT